MPRTRLQPLREDRARAANLSVHEGCGLAYSVGQGVGALAAEVVHCVDDAVGLQGVAQQLVLLVVQFGVVEVEHLREGVPLVDARLGSP